jgi:hypothetical protein
MPTLMPMQRPIVSSISSLSVSSLKAGFPRGFSKIDQSSALALLSTERGEPENAPTAFIADEAKALMYCYSMADLLAVRVG